jgi:hypothetical protein
MDDVRQQTKNVSKKYEECQVSGSVDREMQYLNGAIEERDVHKLLEFAPGKELMSTLCSFAGCVDANAVARAARHHLRLVRRQGDRRHVRSGLEQVAAGDVVCHAP